MTIFTAQELYKKHGVKPEEVKTVSASTTPAVQPPTESALGGKLQNRLGVAGQAIKDVATLKTPLQTGALRVAGAGAGAVNDVIGEAISPAIKGTVDAISNNKAVQDFASKDSVGKGLDATNQSISSVMEAYKGFKEKHPDTALDLESFVNVMSFVPIAKGVQVGADVAKQGVTTAGKTVAKTVDNFAPTAEQIAAERTAKITKGFEEQNTRLKTADKSFTKNTITRKTPEGKTVTITPIDTFAKNGIAPTIDKGSIQMGDYRTGTGELGKIKTKVKDLDDEIDKKLVDTGIKVNTEELKQKAIDNALKNEDFRRSGTVSQNIARIESRFEDYKNSYGDEIDVAELNNIRKTANEDYSPDTQDISRVVGDTAREYVYKASPEARGLLQKQGELLAARKYAETINGTKVTGGRLGNMALRATGAVIGSSVNSLPVAGPVIGMLGGEVAARALQQSQFKSLWTEARALLVKQAKTPEAESYFVVPKTPVLEKVGNVLKDQRGSLSAGTPQQQKLRSLSESSKKYNTLSPRGVEVINRFLAHVDGTKRLTGDDLINAKADAQIVAETAGLKNVTSGDKALANELANRFTRQLANRKARGQAR